MMPDEDAVNSILKPIIGPWYESLENPQKAQEQILLDLLKKYADTDYGAKHGAAHIAEIAEYQAKFPVIDYQGLLPYLAQVKEG